MNSQTLDTQEINETDSPKSRKTLRIVGWVLYTLFCLILFTIIKLPEDRIKSYVESMISSQLNPKGIRFTANENHLSFFFGLSYTMKGVTLTFPPPTPPTKIDEIQVSPSLLSLILGRIGGSVSIEQGDGVLKSSFSIKDTKGSLSFKAKKLDLGKLGLVPLLAGIQASGILEGNGSLTGDFASPTTLEGDISLQLNKIQIDQQSVYGFTIPKLTVSEGTSEIEVSKSKATIKTLRLGKPGLASDDIQGNLTGDIILAKDWERSTVNLKIRFSLSESFMKSFVLLDAILSAGKQADGSYGFTLTGPLTAPFPTPLAPGA